MSYRILIRKGEDGWAVKTEVEEHKIPGMIQDLELWWPQDLRMVLDQDGKPICLCPSEEMAARVASEGEGRRVVVAEIEPPYSRREHPPSAAE